MVSRPVGVIGSGDPACLSFASDIAAHPHVATAGPLDAGVIGAR
jgi:hypothetical protein